METSEALPETGNGAENADGNTYISEGGNRAKNAGTPEGFREGPRPRTKNAAGNTGVSDGGNGAKNANKCRYDEFDVGVDEGESRNPGVGYGTERQM